MSSISPPQSTISIRSHFEKMSEVELVKACQKNNSIAFEELVRRNQKIISAALFKVAPDFNDRSDLVQETLIRIWRSLPTLRNPYAFRRWLNQLVKNLFYDELRYRAKNAQCSLDEPIYEDGSSRLNELADHDAIPDELAQRRELMQHIVRAVNELPRDFKDALVLREFEGRAYEEIAAMTNSELGTIKSRISRARQRVQHKLKGYLAS
ncbi:MAG TPA: sigma-70 family RNA polymerase sigma factor [Oculatellaceae cyanobacterium]